MTSPRSPDLGTVLRERAAISSQGPAPGLRSTRRQRAWFLIALIAGVAAFTGVMLVLGGALSERFAAQVEADLEWRALRGARELAKTTELDTALIREALTAYAASPDVQAIAVDLGDRIVASRGTIASIAPVFAAPAGTLVRGDGYLASWAEAVAEGTPIGKIAVVVSTRRLTDARALQSRSSRLTLIAGAAVAILGALVVLWLTRNVLAGIHEPAPDLGDLGDLAGGLGGKPAEPDEHLTERLRDLDERNRGMRLALAHTAQGFLLFDLGGRIAGDPSAVVVGWLGEPAADATLAGYLSLHGGEVVAQLDLGLQGIAEGVVPLAQCLAQLPRRLAAGAHTFDLTYAPLMHDDRPERILMIMNDVTAQVTRERTAREQREQREVVALSQLVTGDRAAFDEFFAEAAGMVASLDAPRDAEVERVAVRTLKDTCAYYGLETYVELCQEIETSIAQTSSPMSDDQRVAIANGWARVAAQLVGMA
jgi:hypothetical protein